MVNADQRLNVSRVLKLSVVVPFYNVQTYAPDALKSLELNARDDFEFLLVDDCSTDGTPELLERAARELPGAVLLRHERNGGLATARNTGLDAARGEYVTFLDGDDWLAPGHLARTLAVIEALSCDFVRNDHVQVTGRTRSVQRVPYGPQLVVGDPRAGILPSSRATSVDYPYAWAGMYHRRLLDRGLLHFTDGLRTAEDRPWIWRLHRGRSRSRRSGCRGSSTGAGSRPRSRRSRTSASSISSRLSTRFWPIRPKTGKVIFCFRKPSEHIVQLSRTTSGPSKGMNRPWPRNSVR